MALEKAVLGVECWVGHQMTLDKEPGLPKPWPSDQDTGACPGGLSSGFHKRTPSRGPGRCCVQPQLLLMRRRRVT